MSEARSRLCDCPMTLAWACRDLSKYVKVMFGCARLCWTLQDIRVRQMQIASEVHTHSFRMFFQMFFQMSILHRAWHHGTQSQVQRASGQVQYQGLGWSWPRKRPAAAWAPFLSSAHSGSGGERRHTVHDNSCGGFDPGWLFGKPCSLVICAGCYFYIYFSVNTRGLQWQADIIPRWDSDSPEVAGHAANWAARQLSFPA